MGREHAAAGRRAERSHEGSDVSCVRREREVLGVGGRVSDALPLVGVVDLLRRARRPVEVLLRVERVVATRRVRGKRLRDLRARVSDILKPLIDCYVASRHFFNQATLISATSDGKTT